MNTRTRPTNSAPSRKKKEASPSNANTKHSAACIRFCKVAAASAADSVNTEMMTKAAVFIRNKIFGGEIVGQAQKESVFFFIQRNGKHASRISFVCRA